MNVASPARARRVLILPPQRSCDWRQWLPDQREFLAAGSVDLHLGDWSMGCRELTELMDALAREGYTVQQVITHCATTQIGAAALGFPSSHRANSGIRKGQRRHRQHRQARRPENSQGNTSSRGSVQQRGACADHRRCEPRSLGHSQRRCLCLGSLARTRPCRGRRISVSSDHRVAAEAVAAAHRRSCGPWARGTSMARTGRTGLHSRWGHRHRTGPASLPG